MPQAIKLVDAEGRSCIYVPITEDGKVVDSQGYISIWKMNDHARRASSQHRHRRRWRCSDRGRHFEKCPVCSQWFDMRDLAQVAEHIHDGPEIEVLEGPGPPPREVPVH
jgi:hypothetical protein